MLQVYAMLQHRAKCELVLNCTSWGLLMCECNHRLWNTLLHAVLVEDGAALLEWAKGAGMQQDRATFTNILTRAAVQGRGSSACLVWHIVRGCLGALSCIERAILPLAYMPRAETT